MSHAKDNGARYTCALYPTVVTPFNEDLGIDYSSLERLIHRFAQHGCEGVFAVCQSSEMICLTDDEIVELAAFSIRTCNQYGMKCVVSGHVHEDIEAQTGLFLRLQALSPNAIILVLSRLANEGEGDEKLLRNLTAITSSLSPDVCLGVYECPHPYKRLLTKEVIDALKADGRFEFIKDTCCDADMIRRRVEWLDGSRLRLFNANSATLMQSIRDGAAGFSGVMLNFIPEIFEQLKDSVESTPPRMDSAAVIAAHISAASVMERQNYPANAKYYNALLGVFDSESIYTRNGNPQLTGAQKTEVKDFLGVNARAFTAFGDHDSGNLLFPEPDLSGPVRFKSCHASTVLPLDDGAVLAAYFAGDYEKADNVGIWLSRRAGETWHPPVCIAKVNDTAHWNPVLFEAPEGVRLVFKVGKSPQTWISYTSLSRDGGQTWSEAVPYHDRIEPRGPVRSKPIVMSNGLMLAPNSLERPNGAWTPNVDVSSDCGRSFCKLADIPVNLSEPRADTFISGKGAIQPTLWESANGRVHALLRTSCGYVYRSDSEDYGQTWCTAYRTTLPNNNSGIDVEKVGDTLYLAMNPVGGDWAKRTPMVILKSVDNGATFTRYLTLADTLFDRVAGRAAEFSYPAIVHRGGKLYVTYTHMRRSIAYHEISL